MLNYFANISSSHNPVSNPTNMKKHELLVAQTKNNLKKLLSVNYIQNSYKIGIHATNSSKEPLMFLSREGPCIFQSHLNGVWPEQMDPDSVKLHEKNAVHI